MSLLDLRKTARLGDAGQAGRLSLAGGRVRTGRLSVRHGQRAPPVLPELWGRQLWARLCGCNGRRIHIDCRGLLRQCQPRSDAGTSRACAAGGSAMMSLYFAPLACSLATRIALYEAGAHVEYIQVDTRSKRLRDGSDFYPISPLGQ